MDKPVNLSFRQLVNYSFIQFILCNVGSKRQIQTLEQIIKLRERFPTEVAELQEIVLVVLNEVAQGFDVCRLQTVEGANRKVHVEEFRLEQLTHVKYFLVELFVVGVGSVVDGDLLVGEEHEVIDEDLRSFLQCILRVNGTVRSYVEYQLVVVGLLLHAEGLYGVLDVTDGGVNRIDGNYVDVGAELAISSAGTYPRPLLIVTSIVIVALESK